MARRANPAAGPTASETHEELIPTSGGASGIPTTTMTLPQQVTPRPPPEDAPPPPKVRKYQVEGSARGAAGYHVQYAGSMVLLRTGKILDDQNYDVEALRKVGVRLREVT